MSSLTTGPSGDVDEMDSASTPMSALFALLSIEPLSSSDSDAGPLAAVWTEIIAPAPRLAHTLHYLTVPPLSAALLWSASRRFLSLYVLSLPSIYP